MTRQAVSKHLAILEDANLVATVKRGREKLHYLNPVRSTTSRSAGSNTSAIAGALAALKRGLEAKMMSRNYASLTYARSRRPEAIARRRQTSRRRRSGTEHE